MNMEFERKLTIPMEVKNMYPLDERMLEDVSRRDTELKSILSGKDDRILLIIGPCSADNEDSVLDYLTRLKKVSDKVSDRVFIIPRLYTNKPRTTGEGYKGLVHQPIPGGKPDVFQGILATRKFHMRAVKETGFSCADEMLYPENLKYIDDLVGYIAVGARSVEDQQHRLTASGLESPVGMKNPTSGDLSIMINSIHAAQMQHSFIYRGWAAHSMGNPYAHAILRGYTDRHGQHFPNYHYEDVRSLADMYDRSGLSNPAVIIDCNHSNSGKDPLEQPRIVNEVMGYRKYSQRIAQIVKGFMVESYLEEGSQKVGEGVYGKSITDACLGWKQSEELIYRIAELQ